MVNTYTQTIFVYFSECDLHNLCQSKCKISKVILQNGSIKKDLLKAAFHGRKDMVHFHTVNQV
jgi:hypothetical protein